MAKQPTILLRSGWQTVNIGDIAHTPGMLALLEKYIPNADVILWYSSVGQNVEKMLKKRFPKLRFVPAADGAEGHGDYYVGPRDLSVEDAMDQADILLHGSGPALIGEPEVARFHARHPAKPWGTIGTTLQSPREKTAALLDTAKFLYTRETHSLDHLRKAGVTKPETGFAPDATFACDLLDTEKAESFLKSVGLLGERFICVIPRLRRTPYYKIHPDPTWTKQAIAELDALNEKYAEPDHAKLRDVITRYVRTTGGKVLLCSEMEYEVELQLPLLFDKLPDDVKLHVVNRPTYWLNDEAAAVYHRAQGLISYECHSPILCAYNGVSGFYVRHPQDTIKGQMYYDLGLEDRIAESDEITGPELVEKFMKLIDNPKTASNKLAGAMAMTSAAHEKAMKSLRDALN